MLCVLGSASCIWLYYRPMNTFDLLRLHLELECKGVDECMQLYRIPCANPDTLHRVYAVRRPEGEHIFFQEGLPGPLRDRLCKLPFRAYFDDPQQIRAILEDHAPCDEIHIGKSYVFPESITAMKTPDVTRLSQVDPVRLRQYEEGIDLVDREVFGVLVDGRIVSTCESSRENDFAAESWVHTQEDYRRQGYARQVTAAWGNWVIQRGKVPFYSHSMENLASAAVARSLGLILYIEDAGYA